MSRIGWSPRYTTMSGERQPVPRWRYVAVFVCVAAVYFGLSALTGDDHALHDTLVWTLVIGIALSLFWLWKRLPSRPSREPPRWFTRDELIRATSEGFLLFSVIALPDLIRHGVSMRDWMLGPMILGLIAAWLLWVLPHEDRRLRD